MWFHHHHRSADKLSNPLLSGKLKVFAVHARHHITANLEPDYPMPRIGGMMLGRMKPNPAPNVPGNTDAERMDNAVRKFLSVPKAAYLKEEDRLRKLRERRTKRAKKAV